jgi:hypothetical protein
VDGDRLEICQYQPSQKLPRTKDDDEDEKDWLAKRIPLSSLYRPCQGLDNVLDNLLE